MLIVSFKEKFRERMPEWVISAGLFGWGLLAALSPGMFTVREFYHPMLNIMSQEAWAFTAIFIGITRLVFLVINGAWRPSAHIRAIGCAVSCILWGTLFISALSLDWVATATATYGMLLSLDLLSLWFSAGDAKLADLAARGKLKVA